MADLEKVIRGLESCVEEDCLESTCPYATVPGCMLKLASDALELLKSQEPKLPNLKQDASGIYAVCPRCGVEIHALLASKMELENPMPKFCKYCGQAVKWDG